MVLAISGQLHNKDGSERACLALDYRAQATYQAMNDGQAKTGMIASFAGGDRLEQLGTDGSRDAVPRILNPQLNPGISPPLQAA